MILWIKAFHVVAMTAWMAGIFYLPRLFVYHAMVEPDDTRGNERFKVMERKLFRGIMTPAAVVTVLLGFWMLYLYGMEFLIVSRWLHVKLALVVLLIAHHVWCYVIMKEFARDQNKRSHIFYRFFNEFPVFLLIGIAILVIVRPF